MVNGQGLPVQLICHTKPYNNHKFQINSASRYWGGTKKVELFGFH